MGKTFSQSDTSKEGQRLALNCGLLFQILGFSNSTPIPHTLLSYPWSLHISLMIVLKSSRFKKKDKMKLKGLRKKKYQQIRSGISIFWGPNRRYRAAGRMAAAATLLRMLGQVHGPGELGLFHSWFQRLCPVEHLGHWAGMIPPLVNVSLLCKIFILSNLFQFHSFLKRNGGSSVLLVVYKKCNLLYFLPTVNLAPLCPCPMFMEMWLHKGRIHVKIVHYTLMLERWMSWHHIMESVSPFY